jgi:prolipoprotein diacylglyceryltransferase
MADASQLTPSLSSPEAISVKAELYGLIISFTILAGLSLIARLYVRIKAKNQNVEDWLIVAAMVRISSF